MHCKMATGLTELRHLHPTNYCYKRATDQVEYREDLAMICLGRPGRKKCNAYENTEPDG